MYIKPIEQQPIQKKQKAAKQRGKDDESNSFAETLESAAAIDSIEITKYKDDSDDGTSTGGKQKKKQATKEKTDKTDDDSGLSITV